MGSRRGKKQAILKRLGTLLDQYKGFIIASIENVNTAYLNELKDKYSKLMKIIVAKNTLFKLKLKEWNRGLLNKIENYLTGQNAIIFTNEKIVKILDILLKNKQAASLKAGQEAPFDIVLEEGNTGLPAGPLMSEFTSLQIPVKPMRGILWIARKTTVLKKGQEIDPKLANILNLLDIKPLEMYLRPKVAYSEGVVFTPEVLKYSLDDIKNNFVECARNGFLLTIQLEIPSKENIRLILEKAIRNAFYISLNQRIPVKENIAHILLIAERAAKSLKEQIDKTSGK